ncbi:hypothetical protein DQM23_10200, partial [Lacticaseibacillus paracasei]|uniref:hypothetical protein n=2 Tax=Lacticaseibacillus paracasei TaxID=1597 RepID=UPI000E09BBFB
NTILKEADLFCPNSVRINFTIYHKGKAYGLLKAEASCLFATSVNQKLSVKINHAMLRANFSKSSYL